MITFKESVQSHLSGILKDLEEAPDTIWITPTETLWDRIQFIQEDLSLLEPPPAEMVQEELRFPEEYQGEGI
jgi:hypothetical protein